jgi:hypothetical protein
MKSRSTIINLCLIVSVGCLGAAYTVAGFWQILLTLLIILLFGMLSKKWYRSASGFLLVFMTLTVIGVLVDLSTGLMIIACTFALASWDLIQFEQSLDGNSLLEASTPLETHHMRSLALAGSAGLLLAFLSLNIHLQLSFSMIIFLVLVAIGCLIYGMQYIVKKRN